MHRLPARSGFPLLLLAAATSLTLAPKAVDAQRGEPLTARIQYGGAQDSGDGYHSASVEVRYQFADCVGDVAVLYSMDRASIRVGSTYHFGGRSYNVPASIGAPRLETVVFRGPILNHVSQFVASFADPYTQAGAGAGCIGQSKVVFSRKEKLGENSTAAEYLAYLRTLWIQPQAQPRMRNVEVERWIGREIAQRRDDSLKVVADYERRERDRKAQADSLERDRRATDERARRAADSTAAADRQRVESQRTTEEAEEREREREQTAEDARNAQARQAAGDAQTERLNAMWAVEKIKWENAEAALSRGDVATARGLYEELAGSLVYGADAQARLKTLDEQVMAEGVLAVFYLGGKAWSGLTSIRSAMQGSGITLGASYAKYGVSGNMGSAGITFAYVSNAMQRWVPYVDFNMIGTGGVSAAERQPYYPRKSFGDVAFGTTFPKFKLPLGRRASLSPHLGWRYAVTDTDDLSLGQTGLMLLAPGVMVRADLIMVNGKPQFGATLGRIF